MEVVSRLRAVRAPVRLVVVRKRDLQYDDSDRLPDTGFARVTIKGLILKIFEGVTKVKPTTNSVFPCKLNHCMCFRSVPHIKSKTDQNI